MHLDSQEKLLEKENYKYKGSRNVLKKALNVKKALAVKGFDEIGEC